MKAERYNEIKRALFDPEHQTQEDWRRHVREMLAHIGERAPKTFAARLKEIADLHAAAERRRNRVEHGRGAWFMALVDLFEMAQPPEGCSAPTEEEILAAREPDDLRAELARRFDAREQARALQAQGKEEPELGN